MNKLIVGMIFGWMDLLVARECYVLFDYSMYGERRKVQGRSPGYYSWLTEQKIM